MNALRLSIFNQYVSKSFIYFSNGDSFMPWVDDFDEDDFEWPLYADVDVEELMDTSTNGSGGFQSLISSLQSCVDEDDETIELDVDDVEQIIRYANCYGNGGWEDKLAAIFDSDVWDFEEWHYCDN